MIKQLELALLIGQGLNTENVFESETCFFEDIYGKFYVCALGAGIVGKFGSAKEAFERVDKEKDVYLDLRNKALTLAPDYVDIAAELLNIDFLLAEAIDKTHMLGVPIMVITERLRQGTFPY